MYWHLWPQLVVAGCTLIGIGRSIALYGQPKRDSYDMVDVLIGPALSIWILYMGGFWSGLP
jgi:hypothetical protein